MRPRLKDLSAQTIVVTGASSGIGLATARLAARRGARVVLAARSREGLARATDDLRQRGAEAIDVVADVGSADDVRRIAEATRHRFGAFDTWVNNAGVSVYGWADEVPLADQRQVFETNYWGTVHGTLTALEHLRGRGGAIVNLGSALSERAFPLQAAYSASKHAIKGFTDALRMELIHARVPVSLSLIKPGGIDTPYKQHARSYLSRQPRNPPPLYAPQLVAEAILHAASHPVRELTVGGSARMLEAFDHWLPGLSDQIMARLLPRLQQGRADGGERGPDGLYAPAGDARERSGDEALVREGSTYGWAARHPLALVGAAALCGAALGLAGARRRRG